MALVLIGVIEGGKLVRRANAGTLYLLEYFLPEGRYAEGPGDSSAWVFQDDSDVLVVFKGEPPALRRYPDLDTARVAVEMKL